MLLYCYAFLTSPVLWRSFNLGLDFTEAHSTHGNRLKMFLICRLSLGIIHYFTCSSSVWGRLVKKILPTSQQTSLFIRTEFQKSDLWFLPSVSGRGELSPEGTLDWNHFESPSGKGERMLLSDHKLPFSYESCCPTPLSCSGCPLYLPLVSFNLFQVSFPW